MDLHEKCPLLVFHFDQNWSTLTKLNKAPQYKFEQIRIRTDSLMLLHTVSPMDRHTWRKLANCLQLTVAKALRKRTYITSRVLPVWKH